MGGARHSDTASKYTRLQYSADGISFIDGPVITMTNSNNSYVFFSADLSSLPSLSNNSNFAFRIVPEFEATAIGNSNSNYVATVTSYNPAGTIRFDLVSVFGNAGSIHPSIPLGIQQIRNNIVLTWNDPAFVLQSAPSVEGPYSEIPAATSPYSTPASEAQQFFRLKY